MRQEKKRIEECKDVISVTKIKDKNVDVVVREFWVIAYRNEGRPRMPSATTEC
jgi:hypothetical protein